MTNTGKDEIDIKTDTCVFIGEIVLLFSELEDNVNMCLQSAVSAKDYHTVNPLVQRLSFKSKIDALIEIIEIKFESSPECISDFKLWHRRLDKFRVKRNSFIHGIWGFRPHLQAAINVSPGMVGSTRIKQTKYSLSELTQVLADLDKISQEFRMIRKKWYI